MNGHIYQQRTQVVHWKYDEIVPEWRGQSASGRCLSSITDVFRHVLGSAHPIWLALPNDEGRNHYRDVADLFRYIDMFLVHPREGSSSQSDVNKLLQIVSSVSQVQHDLAVANDSGLFEKFCFTLSVGGRAILDLYTGQGHVLAYSEFCNKLWTTEVHHPYSTLLSVGSHRVEYRDAANVERILDMIMRDHQVSCIGISDMSLDDSTGNCGEGFSVTKAGAAKKTAIINTSESFGLKKHSNSAACSVIS